MGAPGNFRGSSRARSCEGKRRFENAGHAKRVMRKVKADGCGIGETRIYKCRFCGKWHWGHAGDGTDRSARVIRAIDRALDRDASIAAETASSKGAE